jgi:hypothetical protein
VTECIIGAFHFDAATDAMAAAELSVRLHTCLCYRELQV